MVNYESPGVELKFGDESESLPPEEFNSEFHLNVPESKIEFGSPALGLGCISAHVKTNLMMIDYKPWAKLAKEEGVLTDRDMDYLHGKLEEKFSGDYIMDITKREFVYKIQEIAVKLARKRASSTQKETFVPTVSRTH